MLPKAACLKYQLLYLPWHPNPFNRNTVIEFELEASEFVRVSVFAQAGRMVRELSAAEMPAGVWKVNWDTSGHTPGIYFYNITYNNTRLTGKMLLRDGPAR